jgi:hypothetical protein
MFDYGAARQSVLQQQADPNTVKVGGTTVRHFAEEL